MPAIGPWPAAPTPAVPVGLIACPELPAIGAAVPAAELPAPAFALGGVTETGFIIESSAASEPDEQPAANDKVAIAAIEPSSNRASMFILHLPTDGADAISDAARRKAQRAVPPPKRGERLHRLTHRRPPQERSAISIVVWCRTQSCRNCIRFLIGARRRRPGCRDLVAIPARAGRARGQD
jgi:hypothetical protein